MTRKTKRQIEKEIAELKDRQSSDVTVTSSVVTFTDDMTEDGKLVIEEIPESDIPDGYELGEKLPTDSAMVEAYWLERSD